MKRCFYSLLILATWSTSANFAITQEKLPPNTKLVKLEITPRAIELAPPFEYRQMLITGVLDNGDRVDVTRMAKFATTTSVKVSERGQVRPVADGQGQLLITVLDQTASVPVKVSGQKAPLEVSFVRDVMPAMS